MLDAAGLAPVAASSNQVALYGPADARTLGTASGLSRPSGYLGSIASSAVTGTVYRDQLTDTGVAGIADTMAAVESRSCP
ncbi:hypothetical protein [Actinoplanes sp. NPDC020271]|uniref:hypothetical protein n=1 Tax=Actinoplanes sp. NPDC020271 TaxID=3363896 RepID=UPI0037AC81E1